MQDLPPIDDAWGSFGDTVGSVAPVPAAAASGSSADPSAGDPLERWHGRVDAERSPRPRPPAWSSRGSAIDADPALHFVHIVVPHAPWFATPWGTRLMPPMPEWVDDPNQPGYAWSGLIRYQRHSLQTGLADAALGRGARPPGELGVLGGHDPGGRRRPRHEHDPARRGAGDHRRQRRGGPPSALLPQGRRPGGGEGRRRRRQPRGPAPHDDRPDGRRHRLDLRGPLAARRERADARAERRARTSTTCWTSSAATRPTSRTGGTGRRSPPSGRRPARSASWSGHPWRP